MLDEVLSALATMADRLGKAIGFSNGFPNDTDAGYWYSMDEAVELEASSRSKHEQWYSDYRQALNTLAKLDFPDEESWWRLDFSCPQVAFTEAPILDGGKSGVWAIGAGRWPGQEEFPDGTHGEISGCEAWPADRFPGVKRVVGQFWDDGVRNWEKVLEDIEAAIRRVSETLFIMKCSLGGIEAERLGELLAKVSEERRGRGAPKIKAVEERRSKCKPLILEGKTQGEIAAELYDSNVEAAKADIKYWRENGVRNSRRPKKGK